MTANDVRFNYNQPNNMDIEAYEGTAFNDTLRGATTDDVLLGGAGNDSLFGLDGRDALSGDLGNDTLDGQIGDDSLVGGAGDDSLIGGLGDDLIDGSVGIDTAEFYGTVAAIVNLLLTSAQITGYGTDTLLGIVNLSSGSGDDSVTGDKLANSLKSGAGNDTLNGDLGDDTIDGGTGVDSAYFINATAATVNLALTTAQFTGYGTDVILGIENLTSGSGNDSLTGDTFGNSLCASDGKDTLEGGLGNDTLDGGAGTDLARFTGTVSATVNLSLTTGQNTGFGTDTLLNIEDVISGTGNDFLIGNALVNMLDGGLGDDWLAGGDGNAGNDVLVDGEGNDTIDGGAGADIVIFKGTANVSVNLAVTIAQATGYGIDSLLNIEVIVSGSGNDTLVGSDLANRFNSGDGNDSLAAGAGDDSLIAGLGDDVIDGGAGVDLAYFRGTADTKVNLSIITAQVTGHGTDILLGIENLSGGSGNDSLTGNGFANAIDGGVSGSDSLFGGAGNDSLNGGLGDDLIDGGTGVDLAVFTGTNAVTVNLAVSTAQPTDYGTDTLLRVENLTSGSGKDSLTGSTAANNLSSGDGDDTLDGGLGNDSLTGGLGNDAFVFSMGPNTSNVDRITDFEVASDAIYLENAFYIGLADGVLNVAAFRANTTGLATTAIDRVIYETDTGNLFFDADGNGAGARVRFAITSANLALTNADFFVF